MPTFQQISADEEKYQVDATLSPNSEANRENHSHKISEELHYFAQKLEHFIVHIFQILVEYFDQFVLRDHLEEGGDRGVEQIIAHPCVEPLVQ